MEKLDGSKAVFFRDGADRLREESRSMHSDVWKQADVNARRLENDFFHGQIAIDILSQQECDAMVDLFRSAQRCLGKIV